MMFDIVYEVGKNVGKDDEWGMEQFVKDIILKCLFELEDVVNVVGFLVGDDLNYIIG